MSLSIPSSSPFPPTGPKPPIVKLTEKNAENFKLAAKQLNVEAIPKLGQETISKGSKNLIGINFADKEVAYYRPADYARVTEKMVQSELEHKVKVLDDALSDITSPHDWVERRDDLQKIAKDVEIAPKLMKSQSPEIKDLIRQVDILKRELMHGLKQQDEEELDLMTPFISEPFTQKTPDDENAPHDNTDDQFSGGATSGGEAREQAVVETPKQSLSGKSSVVTPSAEGSLAIPVSTAASAKSRGVDHRILARTAEKTNWLFDILLRIISFVKVNIFRMDDHHFSYSEVKAWGRDIASKVNAAVHLRGLTEASLKSLEKEVGKGDVDFNNDFTTFCKSNVRKLFASFEQAEKRAINDGAAGVSLNEKEISDTKTYLKLLKTSTTNCLKKEKSPEIQKQLKQTLDFIETENFHLDTWVKINKNSVNEIHSYDIHNVFNNTYTSVATLEKEATLVKNLIEEVQAYLPADGKNGAKDAILVNLRNQQLDIQKELLTLMKPVKDHFIDLLLMKHLLKSQPDILQNLTKMIPELRSEPENSSQHDFLLIKAAATQLHPEGIKAEHSIAKPESDIKAQQSRAEERSKLMQTLPLGRELITSKAYLSLAEKEWHDNLYSFVMTIPKEPKGSTEIVFADKNDLKLSRSKQDPTIEQYQAYRMQPDNARFLVSQNSSEHPDMRLLAQRNKDMACLGFVKEHLQDRSLSEENRIFLESEKVIFEQRLMKPNCTYMDAALKNEIKKFTDLTSKYSVENLVDDSLHFKTQPLPKNILEFRTTLFADLISVTKEYQKELNKPITEEQKKFINERLLQLQAATRRFSTIFEGDRLTDQSSTLFAAEFGNTCTADQWPTLQSAQIFSRRLDVLANIEGRFQNKFKSAHEHMESILPAIQEQLDINFAKEFIRTDGREQSYNLKTGEYSATRHKGTDWKLSTQIDVQERMEQILNKYKGLGFSDLKFTKDLLSSTVIEKKLLLDSKARDHMRDVVLQREFCKQFSMAAETGKPLWQRNVGDFNTVECSDKRPEGNGWTELPYAKASEKVLGLFFKNVMSDTWDEHNPLAKELMSLSDVLSKQYPEYADVPHEQTLKFIQHKLDQFENPLQDLSTSKKVTDRLNETFLLCTMLKTLQIKENIDDAPFEALSSRLAKIGHQTAVFQNQREGILGMELIQYNSSPDKLDVFTATNRSVKITHKSEYGDWLEFRQQPENQPSPTGLLPRDETRKFTKAPGIAEAKAFLADPLRKIRLDQDNLSMGDLILFNPNEPSDRVKFLAAYQFADDMLLKDLSDSDRAFIRQKRSEIKDQLLQSLPLLQRTIVPLAFPTIASITPTSGGSSSSGRLRDPAQLEDKIKDAEASPVDSHHEAVGLKPTTSEKRGQLFGNKTERRNQLQQIKKELNDVLEGIKEFKLSDSQLANYSRLDVDVAKHFTSKLLAEIESKLKPFRKRIDKNVKKQENSDLVNDLQQLLAAIPVKAQQIAEKYFVDQRKSNIEKVHMDLMTMHVSMPNFSMSDQEYEKLTAGNADISDSQIQKFVAEYRAKLLPKRKMFVDNFRENETAPSIVEIINREFAAIPKKAEDSVREFFAAKRLETLSNIKNDLTSLVKDIHNIQARIKDDHEPYIESFLGLEVNEFRELDLGRAALNDLKTKLEKLKSDYKANFRTGEHKPEIAQHLEHLIDNASKEIQEQQQQIVKSFKENLKNEFYKLQRLDVSDETEANKIKDFQSLLESKKSEYQQNKNQFNVPENTNMDMLKIFDDIAAEITSKREFYNVQRGLDPQKSQKPVTFSLMTERAKAKELEAAKTSLADKAAKDQISSRTLYDEMNKKIGNPKDNARTLTASMQAFLESAKKHKGQIDITTAEIDAFRNKFQAFIKRVPPASMPNLQKLFDKIDIQLKLIEINNAKKQRGTDNAQHALNRPAYVYAEDDPEQLAAIQKLKEETSITGRLKNVFGTSKKTSVPEPVKDVSTGHKDEASTPGLGSPKKAITPVTPPPAKPTVPQEIESKSKHSEPVIREPIIKEKEPTIREHVAKDLEPPPLDKPGATLRLKDKQKFTHEEIDSLAKGYSKLIRTGKQLWMKFQKTGSQFEASSHLPKNGKWEHIPTFEAAWKVIHLMNQQIQNDQITGSPLNDVLKASTDLKQIHIDPRDPDPTILVETKFKEQNALLTDDEAMHKELDDAAIEKASQQLEVALKDILALVAVVVNANNKGSITNETSKVLSERLERQSTEIYDKINLLRDRFN